MRAVTLTLAVAVIAAATIAVASPGIAGADTLAGAARDLKRRQRGLEQIIRTAHHGLRPQADPAALTMMRRFGAQQSAATCNLTALYEEEMRISREACGGIPVDFFENRTHNSNDGQHGGNHSNNNGGGGMNVTEVRLQCSSTCINRFLNTLNSTQFGACFNDTMRTRYNAYATLCAPAPGHGSTSCFELIMNTSNNQCERLHHSQTMCRANSECRWDENDRRCEQQFTTAQLDRMCTPCTQRFLAVGASVDPRFDALEYSAYVGAICSRDTRGDNSYCYPHVVPLPQHLFDVRNSTREQQVAALGQTCARKACLYKVYLPIMQTVPTHRAREEYTKCAKMIAMWTNVTTDAEFTAAVQSHCLPRFDREVRSSRQVVNLVNEMCSRNARGDYCIAVWGDRHRDQHINHCAYTAERMRQCTMSANLNCSMVLNNYTAGAGCCLNKIAGLGGTLSQDNVWYPDTLIPAVNRTATSTAVQLTQPNKPVQFNGTLASSPFANWTACAALNNTLFAMRVAHECARLSGPPPVRRLLIPGLRWTALVNNPTLRARIVASLEADIAAALGVPRADVTNGTLVEDTSVQVSRRQTSSGVRFEFVLLADSDTEAAAIATAFDALIASGNFSAPSTANIITNECTDCVAPGTDLFGGNFAVTTTTTTPAVTPTSPGTPAPTPTTNLTAAASPAPLAVLAAALAAGLAVVA